MALHLMAGAVVGVTDLARAATVALAAPTQDVEIEGIGALIVAVIDIGVVA